MIPYGHQSIYDDDIAGVVEVLKGDRFLTQGQLVEKFEQGLAKYCGVFYTVAVNSGTAALHAAYVAAGLSAGDEFITSPMTFVATANAGLWQGARPVFVDIDPNTGNINPDLIEKVITVKTKIIVPIDYTGRPADLVRIRKIGEIHNLVVIEDACQALGAAYQGKKIGSISDLTTFSFHPVKSITTGEGGAILTNNEQFYKTMKKFITHGIIKAELSNTSDGPWYMEQQLLGQNYRLTDFQCALGFSQLKKLDYFIARRREIVARYNKAFAGMEQIITPVLDTGESQSAWHLYVVRLAPTLVSRKREIVDKLRKAGIGVQVHHIPLYFHPYYERLGYQRGLCPVAETWYKSVFSLPIYPGLSDVDQQYVIDQVKTVVV